MTIDIERTITRVAVTMPAGDYIIGDPCYAVPYDRWLEWLNASDFIGKGDMEPLIGELDDRVVLGFGTQYGDGTYGGTDGFWYGVDAGLIGLVPIEVADMSDSAIWRSCSQLISFEEDTVCSRLQGGTLNFGELSITTGDE